MPSADQRDICERDAFDGVTIGHEKGGVMPIGDDLIECARVLALTNSKRLRTSWTISGIKAAAKQLPQVRMAQGLAAAEAAESLLDSYLPRVMPNDQAPSYGASYIVLLAVQTKVFAETGVNRHASRNSSRVEHI